MPIEAVREPASINRAGAVHPPSLVFGFLLAVDVENFSPQPTAEQAKIQEDLEHAMSEAAARADLDRSRWHLQPAGDGELAIPPQGADGLCVVAEFPRRLAEVIREINESRTSSQPLRVRLAIHYGAMHFGRFGPVGKAPITVSRLVEAQVLRQVLSRRKDTDLALIVSSTVYDEVVQSRFHNLDPQLFYRIVVKAKGRRFTGYLFQGDFGLRDTGSPSA
jgi:class 3 adenylate cyclase